MISGHLYDFGGNTDLRDGPTIPVGAELLDTARLIRSSRLPSAAAAAVGLGPPEPTRLGPPKALGPRGAPADGAGMGGTGLGEEGCE